MMPPTSEVKPPRLRAFLVAIGYQLKSRWSRSPSIDSLPASIPGAQRFYNMLNDHGYLEEDIVFMHDKRGFDDADLLPIRENIIRQLLQFVTSLNPGDRVVFYFAGHCAIGSLGDGTGISRKYILPVDYLGFSTGMGGAHGDEVPEPEVAGYNSIILDEFLQEYLIAHLPERCKFTAIIDTCHAGTLLNLNYYWCCHACSLSASGVCAGHPWQHGITRKNDMFAERVYTRPNSPSADNTPGISTVIASAIPKNRRNSIVSSSSIPVRTGTPSPLEPRFGYSPYRRPSTHDSSPSRRSSFHEVRRQSSRSSLELWIPDASPLTMSPVQLPLGLLPEEASPIPPSTATATDFPPLVLPPSRKSTARRLSVVSRRGSVDSQDSQCSPPLPQQQSTESFSEMPMPFSSVCGSVCRDFRFINEIDDRGREIVSISSSHDEEDTIEIGQHSMTSVLVDLVEKYKEKGDLTWKVLLEELGFGVNRYLNGQPLYGPIVPPFRFESPLYATPNSPTVFCQRPQLGTQGKLDLNQKFTLGFA